MPQKACLILFKGKLLLLLVASAHFKCCHVSGSVEGNLSKLIAATRKLSRVGFKHKALSKLELKFVSEPVSADMSPKVGNLSFKEIKKMPRLQVKKGFEQDSVRKQLEEVKEVIQGLEYSLDLIENSAASD